MARSASSAGAELTITSFLDSDRADLNRSRSERAVRNESECYRFLKWIVLSISSTFVIAGGFCLGMTLWALSKTTFLQHLVKSSSAGVYLLIVTIVLLFIAGVIGFVGVLRHNQAVLGSFSVLLFVTLISSLVGGIWTYITATRSDEMSLQRVVHYVRHDYGRDPGKTALLDIIQQSFHCCGSDDYNSWASSAYTSANQTTPPNGTTFTVPDSCCVDPQSQICRERRHLMSKDTDTSFIFINGCLDKLKASFVPYGSYALSASISVAILQISGLLGSVRLNRATRYFANITIGT